MIENSFVTTKHGLSAERTCPVYQKTCLGYAADGTANAPVHTCFGNGGYALSWFVRPFVSYVRHGDFSERSPMLQHGSLQQGNLNLLCVHVDRVVLHAWLTCMLQHAVESCVFSQYTESLIVEHGYTRGEVNATTFHLQVLLQPLASL